VLSEELVSYEELHEFIGRRENKDCDLTKRCAKLGVKGWWVRNSSSLIQGVCVGSYITYNNGYKNHWYIIRTPNGLKMALYLSNLIDEEIEELPRGRFSWIALLT
jgi:hypothetical protein